MPTELLRRPHAVVQYGLIDLEAADALGVLRASVPDVLQAQDREPGLAVEPLGERLLVPLDLRRRAVRPHGDVELPAGDSEDEVVPPVRRRLSDALTGLVCI